LVHLVLIFLLIIIFFARKLFSRTYLTPTGVLCGIWILIISLKVILAPDFYFGYEAVFYIGSFSMFFFIGELLFYFLSKENDTEEIKEIKPFYEHGEEFKNRLRKYIIWISFISLFGSLFYLKAFINHFGSFAEFLIAGELIRADLFDGNISIPAISIFSMLLSYSAINLSMVFYSRYGFYWFQTIPFFSVLILSFSQAARAGMVIVIFQIVSGKIFRLLSKNEGKIELKLVKPLLYILPTLLIIFTLIESFRYQAFEYNSERVEFTKNTFNVYTFGGVSGFSTYLDEVHKSTNDLTYGRYTFSSLYNLLGIAKAETGIYDQYLNVSPTQTANIYSIFRPLLEDFGYLGMLIWALILGMIANFSFRYSLRGSLIGISMCVSIYIYLMFSFIAPLTQFNSFLLSCFLAPLIIQISKIRLKLF